MATDYQDVAARRLKASPYFRVRTVSCKCEQGMVLLRGQVQCYYHKQLAQEAVLGLKGMGQVVNEIEVVDSFR